MKTYLPAAARALAACLFAVTANLHAAALFTPNAQPTGWVAPLGVSSFDFTDGLQVIVQGDYNGSEWSGNLHAFPVQADGIVLFDADRWDGGAQEALDAVSFDTGRRIVTLKGDGTRIPFRYALLDNNQKSKLDSDNTKGTNMVNFLRGDRTNETPKGTKQYRSRAHVLGDIIHSRPLFVDHPTDPRVYVGANDGMLHSFDADSGEEVFAYVPSFFIWPVDTNKFSHIKALTPTDYAHNYYVDASPYAATVALSGGITKVLVSGVGAGGKGLFALNITDPTAVDETAAKSKIMWEITPTTINYATSSAYEDLGYTYGIPVIGKASDGTWVAIVGNGYNSEGGSNQAVLYVINLADGTRKAVVTTTSPQAVSNGSPNGLSSPTAVDTDHDGKIDYVYAGDINGNLWKFDLRNIASPTATKLYTTSPAQPITGRPSVSLHPLGGYMVNFATGRLFTSTDATDAATVYYAYGIRDDGTTIAGSNIVSQTLTAKPWTATGSPNVAVRVSTSNMVDYGATTPKQGWKLALPAGERVVGDGGVVTERRFIFASTNPTVAHAPVAGVVQARGDNWLNEVEFTTGGGGSSPVFDLDDDLSIGDSDRVRDSGGTLAESGPTGVPVSRFIASGVMSQPIVARLQTLSQTYFNTNPDFVASVGPPTDPGVSGGHFDFDIYYGQPCAVTTGKFACKQNTHVHEYDDKFNVTGVNMLHPSLAAFNLANAIPGVGTKFKVLLVNQKMSPAAKFLVGGDNGIPVTSYQTTAGLTMGSLPTYTRGDANFTLILALPLDAFASKDWLGTGDVRAGLVPSQTGCVHANKGANAGQTGPWMNGALTVQVVKATTLDAEVELNVADDVKMGYRLKKDATSQSNLLAQYTMFWHHPNGKCLGDAAWVKNPPQDTSGSSTTASQAAPGAADPKDGLFGGPSGGSGGSGGVSVPGGSDSNKVDSGPAQYDSRTKTGRVSWREMIRP